MQIFRPEIDRTSRVIGVAMVIAMGVGVGLLASTAHEHTSSAHVRKLIFFVLWALATLVGLAGARREYRLHRKPKGVDAQSHGLHEHS